MIKVHTVDGAEVEITMEEARRVHAMLNSHFRAKMTAFFLEYQRRAADNIRKALGFVKPPEGEAEVKSAIAHAIDKNDPDLLAEVLYEAMEWETAYASLKSAE